MGSSVRREPGGIAGFVAIVNERSRAVRYELIKLGKNLDDLGTHKLTWVDLAAILENLPPGNAIQVAGFGERAMWGVQEHLLATVANLLQAANWQRAGDENAPYPRPILPPGQKAEGDQTFGADAIPISEFDDWWDSH